MPEKTLEELKAELDSYKKMNLEREIIEEKTRLESAEKAEEEKKMKNMEEQIRAKILDEMKGESTIEKPETEKVVSLSKDLEILQASTKKYGVKVERYEDLVRRISTGGFKGVR